jgi:hypothetical protein
MGLGKTIMLAALFVVSCSPVSLIVTHPIPYCSIHTTTPHTAISSADEASPSDDDMKVDSDSGDDRKPALKQREKKVAVTKPGQTQSRLGGHDGKLASKPSGKGKAKLGAKTPRATLVVAPMTLLSQWCDELERSSKDGMDVLQYYGNKRTNVQEAIDEGTQVVVTRWVLFLPLLRFRRSRC